MDPVEIAGVITALAAVGLAAKEHILNWPAAIVSSGMYVVVFLRSNLYGDMALQLFYIVMSIYGWYFWLKGDNKKESHIANCKSQTVRNLLVISVCGFVAALFLLKKTDSNVPYLDAFTTVSSLAGTWMLAKKFIENWLVWIVTDIVSVGMYTYKMLYATAFLYFILVVMAVYGYFEWRKTMNLRAS